MNELFKLAGMFVFSTLIVVGIVYGVKDRNRLMQQCLDDGRKEYECRMILGDFSTNGNTTYTIIGE